MKILFRAAIFIAAIFVCDWLLPGIAIKNLESGLIAALALLAINVFIKPIIRFFTFPITILTLGLFPLFINTVMVLLVAFFIDGFAIFAGGYIFKFVWAFAFGILLSIVNVILERLAKFVI